MKFVIKRKEKLTSNIFLMEVTAEWVARSAKPGQFVIVIIDDKGERIPLTICDYDPVKGTIVLVFQVVGKSTEKMASLAVGEKFKDIVGPLGKESLMMNLPDEELKNRRMLLNRLQRCWHLHKKRMNLSMFSELIVSLRQ